MDVQKLHIYTYALSPRTRRNVCCLKDHKRRKPAVSLTIEAGSRSHILRQKQDHPNVIWFLCHVISEIKNLYMRLNCWKYRSCSLSRYVRDCMIMLRRFMGVCWWQMVSNYCTCWVFMVLWRVLANTIFKPCQNTVTIVNCPLFCPKRHTPGKISIRECRRNLLSVNFRCNRGRLWWQHGDAAGEWRKTDTAEVITEVDSACTAWFVFRENDVMRGSMICTLTESAEDEVGRVCGACCGELKCIRVQSVGRRAWR